MRSARVRWCKIFQWWSANRDKIAVEVATVLLFFSRLEEWIIVNIG